ncbi:hypothetical protein IFR05_015977, partial [Cadophora sp. M221]
MAVDVGLDDGPDRIGPDYSPKRTFSEYIKNVVKAFTTKDGLLGSYDYGFLFRPNLPFMKKSRRPAPFFGLNDRMPVFLAILLGFQHALAMLAGVITPPLIIASSAGFDTKTSQYMVSTSLIICGFLSAIQITRLNIYKTPYYLGTGLLSVVGTSFSIIPIATSALAQQMYENGKCPTAEDGSMLPCPEGYGVILGTACLCALLEMGLSFMPPSTLKKIFPPIVTGPTVTLIGVSLIETALQTWAGGSEPCLGRPESGDFMLCASNAAPHALPWGSAEFLNLGFSVFVTIILCERFGSPILKSTSVVLDLLTGCIIAGACGYFDKSSIDAASTASFIWHLRPLVLPLLAVYLILMIETIGDITATSDVSRLQVSDPLFDSRIQGGVLACLGTITPMSTFAQNGMIALTRCANSEAGYTACFFLTIMGVFSKFAAALVAIPSSVLGGMTTFLFASVAISGISIISAIPFTR